MLRELKKEDLRALADAAIGGIRAHGSEFYAWKDAPAYDAGAKKFTQPQGWGENAVNVEVTPQGALDIYEQKLNGAYGERFALSVGYAVFAAEAGIPVHLLQKVAEKGLPFSASGWLILAINHHPVFHIAPPENGGLGDLDPGEVREITTLVEEGGELDELFAWKGTDKIGELSGLIAAAISGEFNPPDMRVEETP